jgi:hypothetical protein
MMMGTMVVYIGTLVAFACLFAFESKKFTTETVIVASDQTGGADGYTCEMISKISQSYKVAAAETKDLQYSLVNVIESLELFNADMAVAKPCEQTPVYFPGTVTSLLASAKEESTITFVVVYDASLAYVVVNYAYLYRFNVSAGSFLPLATLFNAQQFAVDKNGNALVLGYESPTVGSISRVEPDGNVTFVYQTSEGGVLVNDNQYNIYLLEFTNTAPTTMEYTLTAIDVYSEPAVASTVFTYTDFNTTGVTYALAVYKGDDGDLRVYFETTDGWLMWENGLFTHYAVPAGAVQMFVDSSEQTYFTTFPGECRCCAP